MVGISPTGVCRYPGLLCRYLFVVRLFIGLLLDIVAAFGAISSSYSAQNGLPCIDSVLRRLLCSELANIKLSLFLECVIVLEIFKEVDGPSYLASLSLGDQVEATDR